MMGRLISYSIVFTCLILTSVINGNDDEVDDESQFTYRKHENTGPDNWGSIKPEWAICNHGKLQSPVDLKNNKRVVVLNETLETTYHAAPAILVNRGHDIMVRWELDAGSLMINGTEYKLTQAHWHTPSEHRIDGKYFGMEMHMVHKSSTGELAVVGMMYEVGDIPDPFLSHLLTGLEHVKDKVMEVSAGEINPNDIKLTDDSYYSYLGSLTVPPCTEGVSWTIIRGIRSLTKKQIVALRLAVHDRFGVNARPVQL